MSTPQVTPIAINTDTANEEKALIQKKPVNWQGRVVKCSCGTLLTAWFTGVALWAAGEKTSNQPLKITGQTLFGISSGIVIVIYFCIVINNGSKNHFVPPLR